MEGRSRWQRTLVVAGAPALAMALVIGACEAARTDPSRMPVETSPSTATPMPPSAAASALPTIPTPAPPVGAGDRFRLVVNEADGYQIRVPVAWVDRADRSEPGVRSFGYADMRQYPALSVSVGTPGGSVRVCDEYCDATTVAISLDALEAALQSVPLDGPDGPAYSEIHSSQSLLGGEPARVERVQFPRGYLFGPVAFYRIFAIREGRPVVLTFDHWSTALRGKPPGQLVSRIIDSFRFIEPKPAARWQDYHSDTYGYDIQVPAGWAADEADGVTFFREDEQTKLVVSVGDSRGRVSVCPGGPCREVVVRSLDDLDAILPAYDSRIGPAPQREVKTTTRLDGFRARLTAPLLDFPLMSIPGWTHAFSAGPGRAPIVLRFSVTVGGHVQQTALPTEMQRHVIGSFALE